MATSNNGADALTLIQTELQRPRLPDDLIPFIRDFSGTYATNFQVTFTGVFVSILPLAVVYILFHRLFVEGVMANALKG